MSSVDYKKNAFTIINSDHNINNNNILIVVYSQHPYCCVNNIVLTLFLKLSKFDVLICSLSLFHSHGAAYMKDRPRKVLEQSLLTGGIIISSQASIHMTFFFC